MNFIEYYRSLNTAKERKTIRTKITESTFTSYPTFFGWVRRKSFPPLVKEKISHLLQMPIEELFPESETKSI